MINDSKFLKPARVARRASPPSTASATATSTTPTTAVTLAVMFAVGARLGRARSGGELWVLLEENFLATQARLSATVHLDEFNVDGLSLRYHVRSVRHASDIELTDVKRPSTPGMYSTKAPNSTTFFTTQSR